MYPGIATAEAAAPEWRAMPDNDSRLTFEEFSDRESASLRQALRAGSDMIGELLRFHLVTECQLERMIQAALPRGDRVVDHAGLTYRHKLELVNGFDVIPDDVIRSLRKLDALRERYAHQTDAAVTAPDIGSVGRPLGMAFTRTKYDAGDDLERLLNSTFGLVYGFLIKGVYRLENPPEPSVLDRLADETA